MITILMYHQIADVPRDQDPKGLAIPPAQFEQQVSYLKRNGFTCLSLTEAVHAIQNGERRPGRSVVFTFDDGYQDVHSRALPIMEKFGFTAAVFLVAGQIGCASAWWGQDGVRSGLLLTQAEVQDLAQRGFTLGSHTLNHPFLDSLDDQSAYDEIRRSKEVLEREYGVQIDFFSYPYSNSSSRIEKLVAAAGYTAACAGDGGPWSLFHLWRTPCSRYDTPLIFAMKARGWYDQRTALRESAPGRVLRRSVRTIRRRLTAGQNGSRAIQKYDLMK
jgi:peptidoglycan/xylan/chitin deacetylase (PgdA/CDA1 family)